MKLALSKTNVKGYKPFLQWQSALPFVQNKRALLIHRPRSVDVYRLHKHPHMAVHFLCGNGSTGTDKFTFMEAPPVDSILCAKCEQKAIALGLPSAHSLAGHHVHTGGIVARAHCCDYEIAEKE